ncbi:glycoside hydrolase family 55 protein [Cesiribacter sp. SM1]|uniref:glycoside hydrolase family 55 protein n=1 Tax=Cesiribacter sp. SM1 TaxID=2861196 RepID=UPI001CD2D7DD|nr:glycoside hydrolase family 55 protein [Cesiribacter sp. SM1]
MIIFEIRCFYIISLVLFFLPNSVKAQLISYPKSFELTHVPHYTGFNVSDAGGFYNVKDFGAKGDGISDDTNAIQAAMDANRAGANFQQKPDYFFPRPKTLYFPAGTYLISDALQWEGQAMMLMGQGQGITTIKLKDSARGFSDIHHPKALVKTPAGNQQFHNYIKDLTICTGAANPGTIAIDFVANNSGGIINVGIVSEDGLGSTAISMIREFPGPCLLQNVSIKGFDYAIQSGKADYSITLENIFICQQNIAGVKNDGNILIIRKLTSDNSVPALLNTSKHGMIVVLNSRFTGGSQEQSAIENLDGCLFARDIIASGYSTILTDRGNKIRKLSLEEYVVGEVYSPHANARYSLRLPVEETPVYHEKDTSSWASLSSPGWYGDTRNWQKIIDSGKSSICIKTGTYMVKSKNYTIPLGVHKINAFGAVFNGNGSQAMKLIIKEGDESSPPLFIEHIGYGVSIEHLSKRPLVIRHSRIEEYVASADAGNVYLENVEIHKPVTFYKGQKVWARQFNNEAWNTGKIWNKGADVWIMGLKTERRGYAIKTTHKGRTELLGGLLYPVERFDDDLEAAFICEDADQSLIFGVSAYSPNAMYPILVRESRKGIISELKRNRLQNNRFIPLYVSKDDQKRVEEK